MQDYDLLNPGIDQVAQTLRKVTAHAISNLEGVAGTGAAPGRDLANFFADAANKTPGFTGAAIPVDLPDSKSFVTEGDALWVADLQGRPQAQGTARVAAGNVTNVSLPADASVAHHLDRVSLCPDGANNTLVTCTARVSNGRLFAVHLPPMWTVMSSFSTIETITAGGKDVPASTVQANPQGYPTVVLSEALCIVEDRQEIVVGSRKFTFHVTNGEITRIDTTNA